MIISFQQSHKILLQIRSIIMEIKKNYVSFYYYQVSKLSFLTKEFTIDKKTYFQ